MPQYPRKGAIRAGFQICVITSWRHNTYGAGRHPREKFVIKQSNAAQKSNNQNPTNTTFPSHSFSESKQSKSRENPGKKKTLPRSHAWGTLRSARTSSPQGARAARALRGSAGHTSSGMGQGLGTCATERARLRASTARQHSAPCNPTRMHAGALSGLGVTASVGATPLAHTRENSVKYGHNLCQTLYPLILLYGFIRTTKTRHPL